MTAARELVINGPAVPFRTPDGPSLELVRLSVDGRQIPRGLVLAATLEWNGDRRVMVLDDEPGRTGQIGLRRHDPRWVAGDLVFAGGTEIWIGIEALSWSGARGLQHSAGRASAGRSIEPFLPLGFPHDELVGLPVEQAVLSLYMISIASPEPEGA